MLQSDLTFEPIKKTLETGRLLIRIDTEAEYCRMFETSSDEVLKAHFGITNDAELQIQKGKVKGGLSTYRTSVVFFHLIERTERTVIGNFAYHNWYPIHRRSEMGYAMNDAYKGKGYMSEALQPLIAFGFEAMNLNRIEAFIHPENMPSRKLVMRAGFKQEGWLHEHYCKDGVTGDSLVYGLLLKDYANGPRI